jgi:hypothetical protein
MKRVQFEVPEDRVDQMDKLQSTLGLSTRKQLLNNALAILKWAVDQRQLGRKVASIDEQENSYNELVMPSLQHVPVQSDR